MFSRNISKLVLSNNFKSNKLIKYCFHANLIQLNQNIYSQSINTHLIKLNDVQTPLLAKLRYKSRNKKVISNGIFLLSVLILELL